MKLCELCELKVIEKEFFRNKDFIVMSCMSCKIPMVVPFKHIDPKSKNHENLRKRMEEKLTQVAKAFYNNNRFFIDKQENKVPLHMHWHARKINRKNLRLLMRNFIKNLSL